MKKLFVCFLAVALVFAFTVPTMAADWNFYGNTRFQTFSVDKSKELGNGLDSDTDTAWLMQNNSRFGGKVAAGDIAGHIEVAAQSTASGNTGVAGKPKDNIGLRHLTGTWNFGAGSLLVGHTWAVVTNLLSNQAANQGNGLLGFGSVYQARQDQIRLTFGGLKIGLLSPTANGWYNNASMVAAAAANAAPVAAASLGTDVTLPKIEIAYRFATDMFWVEPYLGYQSYDEVTVVTPEATKSITSLIYGVKGKVNIGPAYIGAGFTMGTNPGTYGLANGYKAWYNGTDVKDADYYEYMLLVGFKMNDMVTFEGGYGSQYNEIDLASMGGSKIEDRNFSYYIQADVSLAPGVHLIPEFSMISQDDIKYGGVSTDQGETTYIGAKWQINF
jgi:hypothetical protein